MMQYELVKAERLSQTVEANMVDLIDKLCDGESEELRGLVWRLLYRRMTSHRERGSCFRLPSVEDC